METFIAGGNPLDNNLSADRQLVLKLIPGQSVKDSRGRPDSRLWNGENEVHAFLDPVTLLWRVKYSIGDIPPSLKQSFTSFKRLMMVVEPYFRSRGLEIVEVKN